MLESGQHKSCNCEEKRREFESQMDEEERKRERVVRMCGYSGSNGGGATHIDGGGRKRKNLPGNCKNTALAGKPSWEKSHLWFFTLLVD